MLLMIYSILLQTMYRYVTNGENKENRNEIQINEKILIKKSKKPFPNYCSLLLIHVEDLDNVFVLVQVVHYNPDIVVVMIAIQAIYPI